MFEIIAIEYMNNYVRVKISTGESIRFPYDIFKLYKLDRGKVIDHTEYQQLKDESNIFECNRKALDFLSIRNRSYREMENYLFKKGFSRDIIKGVLNKLNENGYIDDLEFAKKLITYKMKRKVVGKNLLKKELFRKGISREIVKRAIKETGSDRIDSEEVYQLAKKKLEGLKNKKNIAPKLFYYLNQRGFESDVIHNVIERLKKDGFEL